MSLDTEWQQAIGDVFIARMDAPFCWGSNDCCLFAADCFYAATGVDPASSVRGTYMEARGAYRVMVDLGGLAAIAARWCGQEVAPSEATFGDIGLLNNSGRPCLAVFGGQYFHAPGEAGLTIFPVETCLQAWRLT